MISPLSRKPWIRVAFEPPIVKRSVRVALVVGTLLALINQGDLILSGQLDPRTLFKIGLTYLVPYSVSTWASVQTVRAGYNQT